jgi:hypothetical protein
LLVSNETAYKDRGEVIQAPSSKEEAEIKLKENIKGNTFNQPKPAQREFTPSEISNLKSKEPQNFNTMHDPSALLSKQTNDKPNNPLPQQENKITSMPQQIANQNALPNTNNTVSNNPITKPTFQEQDVIYH